MSVGDLKAEAPCTAADLLSTLEEGDLDMENESLVGLDLLDTLGSSFHEAFMDLTEYLQKECSADFETTDVGTLDGFNSTNVKGKKRTASDVFGEELKPTPNPDHCDYILKKRRHSSTSSIDSAISDAASMSGITSTCRSKTQKYLERRRKNNIASKRSRETRKEKFSSMEQKAADLERDNAKLREKVTELEALTKRMREILIQRMVKKSQNWRHLQRG